MRQAWKKAGAIGEVLIILDILVNTIRLYNELIKPRLAKKSKKKDMSADENKEDA
ncbi:MAG: hypothetical protein J1E37_08245 [Prevotella sp.]|nr:hypothetical protein [Prevotella sp.]